MTATTDAVSVANETRSTADETKEGRNTPWTYGDLGDTLPEVC